MQQPPTNLPQSSIETDAQKLERMKWWLDARFGMFIHWGLYSLASRHEWVKQRENIPDDRYQVYFDTFDPDLFDPGEWARLAKSAGMKYFVITTKHHEGFCLWDSEYTDYKVTKTPYGRDVLAPMIAAFRAEGLRVGLYHSLLDWHHPDYPVDRYHPMANDPAYVEQASQRDVRKYAAYLHNQVRELLTRFGKIDYLFLDYSFPQGDGGKGRQAWQSDRLIRMIRQLQPGIIVNDRLDLLDTPDGWDFRTPEQFKPREWVTMNGKRVPWETCQTFSGSWGYDRDETHWKSTRQLLALLIETVSKGGNLLLNVGPTGRGDFEPRAVARLKEIGEWMKHHSRSVYGCTQAPDWLHVPDNCLATYNPQTRRLYIHVLDWPMGKLYLEGLAGKIRYAQLLHDASEIQIVKGRYQEGIDAAASLLVESVSADTVILDLPMLQPEVSVPVIEIFLST